MKRTFDILISLLLLIGLLPTFLIIAAIIKLTSTGPILYWSQRVGRESVNFMMPKFRTMIVGTPLRPTDGLDDPTQYITRFGAFLRRSSLDELPQLYSVLTGKMSLIGPRPVLPSQTRLVKMRKRLGVDQLLPGITGWAQVNGRDDIAEDEKVRLDAEYLSGQSFGLDLKILCLTVLYVLRSKGVWH